MGLTIHYRLHADTRSPTEARRLIEVLRKRALDLPFAKVGEVVELAGDACDYEKLNRDHPHRWLLIQAGQYVERKGIHFHIEPKHVIAFSTDPGDGCEEANFGLCRYPGIIDIRDPRTGHPRKLRTELKDWCWSSFCKTQYATRHGVEHFLRCHLLVIRMLDIAKEIGILANVSDEGDFWEKRDIQSLAKEVGEWNQGIAAFVGRLKDLLGGNIDAPITKFPNFEHLEAEGQ
ncbi:MAG: hypothetical protein ACLP9L_06735 [Thermoguttaceae bacterium]